jgi:hypothetical protein
MPSTTFSIVGSALIAARIASAVTTQCVLNANPPADAVCGTVGYLSNENSLEQAYFGISAESPEGCAATCAADSLCKDFYYGEPDYPFCELHSASTAADGFAANAGSYYSGYDESCFTCGPQPVCPGDDGAQVTLGGDVFNIHCGADYYGGDLSRVSSDTFADCLTSCATTTGCVSVAYNGNNCYMKSQVSTPRQNSNVWGAVLASSEEAFADRLQCPGDDGQTYTATNGGQYVLHCGADYYGGDLSSLAANTLEDCLNACDTTSGCTDVAYHSDGQYCYLKNQVTDARSDSSVWGAIKVQSPAPKMKQRDAALPPTAKNNPLLNGTASAN